MKQIKGWAGSYKFYDTLVRSGLRKAVRKLLAAEKGKKI